MVAMMGAAAVWQLGNKEGTQLSPAAKKLQGYGRAEFSGTDISKVLFCKFSMLKCHFRTLNFALSLSPLISRHLQHPFLSPTFIWNEFFCAHL